MSISTGATDVVGGGYPTAFAGYPNAGIGGLGLVGLIGLNSLWGGRGGWGDGWGGGGFGPNGAGVVASTVADQNISEFRKDVQGVNTTVESLGNELQGAINMSNMNNANNFRALDNQICGLNQNLANLNYAQTLQGFQNTQAIKDQATANQIIAAENACAIKGLIQAEADNTRSLVHAETDRVIALINANQTQDLRDRILELTRRGDNREIEINVQNTANATQNQMQAQLQQQRQELATFMNVVGDQLARQTNSIVNLGTMTASGQTNSASQTKVNS